MVKYYYLPGPDGSGKTTFLEKLEDFFQAKGYATRHIWLRSPKILSKPLMAYCRFIGLTKYFYVDGIRYGGHEFHRSWFVSRLFPILQLLDFQIKWFFEKRKICEGEIVLLDRFALDTLADLMVSTHRFDLYKTWIGESFIKLIPINTQIFSLHVDEKTIRSRKKDTLFDENLGIKIKAFELLTAYFSSIEQIENKQSVENGIKKIVKRLMIK
jgi:thymidylate kinase